MSHSPNCKPESVSELLPAPFASRTFTATRDTDFATPNVVPPMVPETWVPWPFSSVSTLLAKFAPKLALPPNCFIKTSQQASTTAFKRRSVPCGLSIYLYRQHKPRCLRRRCCQKYIRYSQLLRVRCVRVQLLPSLGTSEL